MNRQLWPLGVCLLAAAMIAIPIWTKEGYMPTWMRRSTDYDTPTMVIQLKSKTEPTVTRFDLCNVLTCTGDDGLWVNKTVYLCRFDQGKPLKDIKWCSEYPNVFWVTKGEPYEPDHNVVMMDFQKRITIKRDRPYKKDDKLNPIEISIRAGKVPYPDLGNHFFLVIAAGGEDLSSEASDKSHSRALIRINMPVEVKEPTVDAVEREWDQHSDVILDVHPTPQVQSFQFDMCIHVSCMEKGTDKTQLPILMWVYNKGQPTVLDEGCMDRSLILWSTVPAGEGDPTKRGVHKISDEDKLDLRDRITVARRPIDRMPGRITLGIVWTPGKLSPWNKHYVYLGIGTEPLMGKDSVIVKFNLNVPFPVAETDDPELGIVTGFSQRNYWMSWVQSTTKSIVNDSCVACAQSRPELKTIPSPFSDNQTFCMMHLHMTENPIQQCRWLEKMYPLAGARVLPPLFTPVQSQHLCLRRISRRGKKVGHIPQDWCKQVFDTSSWENATQLVVARSDVYWYCGHRTLLNVLPPDWTGTCTILSLLAPLTIVPATIDDVLKWRSEVVTRMHRGQERSRSRRAVTGGFDLYGNSPVYIDAIGVPRGVPEQYRLVDDIAAGFESLIPQVTINKNVARINYVHFSVQRLTNFTRDAIEGIHGQLSATSLMAEQNRMALDFLLAESGGTCALIGAQCCTWIPKNTDNSTGSIVKALKGLKGLSVELADLSGPQSSLSKWLGETFGAWKQVIVTICLAFSGALVVLLIIGCCCIPCIRCLIIRCLESAIDARAASNPQSMLVQVQHLQPRPTDYQIAIGGLVPSYAPTK